MNNQTNNPPVSQGQKIDVFIDSVGDKGDGVARVKGFVLFVSGAKKGERIQVEIQKVSKNVAFARKIGPAQAATAPESLQQAVKENPVEQIDYASLGEGSEDFGEDFE